MWPYTHDESHWLTSDPAARPVPLYELEIAARRYRARVIAGWLRSAFFGLRRTARAALYRGRKVDGPPPKNAVGAD